MTQELETLVRETEQLLARLNAHLAQEVAPVAAPKGRKPKQKRATAEPAWTYETARAALDVRFPRAKGEAWTDPYALWMDEGGNLRNRAAAIIAPARVLDPLGIAKLPVRATAPERQYTAADDRARRTNLRASRQRRAESEAQPSAEPTRYSTAFTTRDDRAAAQLRNATRFASMYHAGQIGFEEAYDACYTQVGAKRAAQLLAA